MINIYYNTFIIIDVSVKHCSLFFNPLDYERSLLFPNIRYKAFSLYKYVDFILKLSTKP